VSVVVTRDGCAQSRSLQLQPLSQHRRWRIGRASRACADLRPAGWAGTARWSLRAL